MQEISDIKSAFRDVNKWWTKDFSIEFKSREIYGEIKKFIDKRQIIALTGLRRVGKTTIMFKIIEENLKILNKENVVYFSFDYFNDVKIREVIEAYCDIFGKNIESEKYIFFFDEIQKLENWEEQIKRYYDNYPNIKFIISGSESLFIRKKSRESLAGRFYEFSIKPLSFKEFISFKNIKIGENLELYERDILNLFRQYIITNGFPELINEDIETCKKYLKESIIEKIIYKDIPEIFDIKDIDLLDKIVRIIMLNPGQIIEISKLSSELSVSRQTLSLYLRYLEDSFLIRKLYNFSRNIRKTEKKSKKFYCSIIHPDLIDSEKISKAFENFIVIQLEAEFFYIDTSKNEVDIIKMDKGIIKPIEIKYGKIDIDGLKKFMKKFNIKIGYIISYNKKQEINFEDKTIKVIPFYFVLLNKTTI
ncbi:MAG: ATP-binding protein [archaeon]